MKNYPSITIVTPSYNQAQYLEETILSVLEQNYPKLEYIIMDGGSTDGSVEIIKKYEKHLTYWVSAKDRGQAHALHQGFQRGRGAILGWINSDDFYLSGALEEVSRLYRESGDQLLAGPVINFNSTTGKSGLVPQRHITFRNMIEFGANDKLPIMWHQPGVFFPRKFYEMVGGIDEQFRYMMDQDLLCRLLLHTGVVYTKTPLAKFRVHHDSKTYYFGLDFFQERIRLLEKWRASSWMPAEAKRVLPKLLGKIHILAAAVSYKSGGRRVALQHGFAALRHYPQLLLQRWFYTENIFPYLVAELGFGKEKS